MDRFFFFMLVLLGPVLAHTEYKSSTPAANSTVKGMPQAVVIRFSEAVEVRLSTFKVYPLEAPPEVWGSATRLRQLAQPLVRRVLLLKNDAARRADAGLATTAHTSQTVTLVLKPGLKPGAYVVMWKNLAVDGHTQSDFFVFVYRP
ncbi:copper resistance CopC family protein [Meiothermus cerbereus]|uniref:copper resistance CopC family protein n=1 Tax=Meiothermus cerbereus TaxID=65552 RepID=UPI003EEABE65